MKSYSRTATLTNVHVDEERGIVTGVNDFGAIVIMTVKQFKDMYAEGFIVKYNKIGDLYGSNRNTL